MCTHVFNGFASLRSQGNKIDDTFKASPLDRTTDREGNQLTGLFDTM